MTLDVIVCGSLWLIFCIPLATEPPARLQDQIGVTKLSGLFRKWPGAQIAQKVQFVVVIGVEFSRAKVSKWLLSSAHSLSSLY
jgi:hypothetical protein